jgi:ADP-ribosylglycohydrolase
MSTHIGPRALPLLAGLALAAHAPTVFGAPPPAEASRGERPPGAPGLVYEAYEPHPGDRAISRTDYARRFEGFWLAQCIANWTGLITEMDKIGGDGLEGRGAGFYTREDWGGLDQPNIWGGSGPEGRRIDFVFRDPGDVWGADDDTDIEYIYLHLMLDNETSRLTGEQIRDGWLAHIWSDANTPHRSGEGQPENFLWVSNQRALDLMLQGKSPPETSDPALNPDYEMIDAQLTTEIFGLFAPARPDVALEIAYLPIRTTARRNAAWIAEFYVVMHSLASTVDPELSLKDATRWLAAQARRRLPDESYSAKMYDFVLEQHSAGRTWEEARDALYERYQVGQADGYDWPTRETVCEGCFAAGINFGASIVSLLYGEGDLLETIRIGALSGWDSDNPTATWGGLLGFMLGADGVEEAFGRTFADRFNIHRTRRGFENDGIDTFARMAEKGVQVVDRVVQERTGGGVSLDEDVWYVPQPELEIPVATE